MNVAFALVEGETELAPGVELATKVAAGDTVLEGVTLLCDALLASVALALLALPLSVALLGAALVVTVALVLLLEAGRVEVGKLVLPDPVTVAFGAEVDVTIGDAVEFAAIEVALTVAELEVVLDVTVVKLFALA